MDSKGAARKGNEETALADRQSVIDKAHSEKYGPFAEIVARIDDAPEMPEDLLEFSRPITTGERRKATMDVFFFWLRFHLAAKKPYVDPDIRVPCEQPGVRASFFPEWPEEEDFVGGVHSPSYKRAYAEADIDTAIAKRACSGCPFKNDCLARALYVGQPGSEVFFEGVAGGWGARVQTTIFNKVEKLRLEFLRGEKEASAGVPADQRQGMSDATRKEMKRRCFEVAS